MEKSTLGPEVWETSLRLASGKRCWAQQGECWPGEPETCMAPRVPPSQLLDQEESNSSSVISGSSVEKNGRGGGRQALCEYYT